MCSKPLYRPALNYEALFNKEPTINSINRISNTSDAIRGVQFKTNTNEASVQSYQDAARMSVGAKIEVVEDVMSDLCKASVRAMRTEHDQGRGHKS